MLALLLAVLRELLLHLPLELLRFALQHLLLPFLFGCLGAVALLRGEIRLALGEFIELLQRIGHLLGFLLFGGSSGLAGLILILLGIEFEIEKRGEIARSAAATTPSAAAASERNLNLPERGFGAQQVLQGLLLVGDVRLSTSAAAVAARPDASLPKR